MSARETWKSLLDAAFPQPGRVLWVGDKRLAPAGATVVDDLDDAQRLPELFDGIGWVARSDVRAGLGALRPRLRAGGVMVVAFAEPLLRGALTRALRLGSNTDSLALGEACEALLLTGFEQPHVLVPGGSRVLLSARKPERLGLLDAFFEQPVP